ncbi:sensor histidine kinase [Nonomuraea sediminis]|uniref:sensor histidine kinase n=1 Tax=Nonomuraea sediminis TaxID=2835864 RepID=UPI001BDD5BCD|nr:ATP-binding protein [Nonomuraea sediminis]
MRERWLWYGAAVVAVLVPTLVMQPGALPIGCSAAAAVAAAIRPPRRVWIVVALSALSLVAGLLHRGPLGLASVLGVVEVGGLLVLTARLARCRPVLEVVVAGLAIEAAMAGFALRSTLRLPVPTWTESLTGVAVASACLGGALGVGLYLRSLDLRRARAVVEARRAQRLEVARDLHDFVAHEVTGIVLEAQAAQLGELDPAAYRRIEEAGLRALASMDHTVRVLRLPDDDPPPTRVYGLADLPGLVGRFGATGTAHAALHLDPGLELPRELEAMVHHTVLEALTNVRRHAGTASQVTVSVTRVPGPAVEVSITDTGAACGPRSRRGGGTGLDGLRERAGTLGGVVTAGPHGPGWRVVCRLPY